MDRRSAVFFLWAQVVAVTPGLAFAAEVDYAGVDYAGTVLDDSPVAFYRFEETSGTLAHDLARKSAAPQSGPQPAIYHETKLGADGALIVNPRVSNHSADFDGTTSHITATASPDVFDLTGALTIELWVKPTKGGESVLEARIKNYELAARMQLTAAKELDLSGETKQTQKLYGLDDKRTASYGRRLLLARRLVERGVRFVQVLPPPPHQGGMPRLAAR